VCGEAVIDETKLPPEIREKLYRPSKGEEYDVEVHVEQNDSFGEEEIEEPEIEPDQ